MPPAESRALKADDRRSCDRAIGADEHVYPKGRRGGLAGPTDEGIVTIVYTRFWSNPRWAFVTEGRNIFGDILAEATRETFDEARRTIEDDLRTRQIIT